jgi:hypothetical protein
MSVNKRVLDFRRVRQVPEQFSWIDHRLVREHRIEQADVCAWALYLVLVCVADGHGLSYYGDASLCRRLRLAPERQAQARRDLFTLDLIAYEPPLYQVLSLPPTRPVAERCAQLRAMLERRP